MIRSLHLLNFQSHEASHLEFDPGVNVIAGASDSGKSAIIRALRWLAWNRPSGNDMRSTWGGKTQVEAHLDFHPGHSDKVIRIKDKEEIYFCKNVKYKAFRTDVPEEVKQTLNLNEINLQSQLDSHFLLSASPGEVAKHFNKVAHLDQIDLGLKNVQSWLREIERTISSKEEQLTQADEDLQKFEHLDKFEIKVEVLEGLQTDMITKVNQVRKLEKLVLDSVTVSDLIEEQNQITKAGLLVDTILDWYKQKEQTNQMVEVLEELIGEIYEAEDLLENESQILGAEKSVTSLLPLFEKESEKQDNCALLQKLVDRVQHITKQQIFAENHSKQLQTEFNEVFPSTCPLCGKPK